MKKKLAVLLAAVMLLGCMPLTAAAEDGPQYWLTGEPGIPAPVAPQAPEEFRPAAPGEDYDWEAEYAAQLRQEKVDLGMPYPDGANVSLNGEYLTLGGVAPIGGGEGRVPLLPFRAFLEGMGGKVAYQNGQFVATMPDGTGITAEPGSTTLTYTVGDKINTVEMYETPTVVNRVTYVAAHALAEALGLSYEEDYYYSTVHLTDWTALSAELNSGFTALNALLAAEHKSIDPAKTYAFNLGGSYAWTYYKENGSDTAKVSCAVDGVVNAAGLEGSLQVKLDQGGMKNTWFAGMTDTLALGLEDRKTAQNVLEMLSNLKVDVRTDLNTGKAYLRGNHLSKLPESPLPDNTWLELESAGVPAPLTQLPEAEFADVSGLLRAWVGRNSYADAAPARRARELADTLRAVLGDDCFAVSKSGEVTTYTNRVDQTKLLSILKAGVGADLVADVTDRLGGMLPAFSWNLTFRLKGSTYMDSKLTANVKIGGANPTEVNVTASATDEIVALTATAKGTYTGKMEFKLDASLKETTRAPLTAPAAGEKTEKLEDYMY